MRMVGRLYKLHGMGLMLWNSDFIIFLTALPRPWSLCKVTSGGGVSRGRGKAELLGRPALRPLLHHPQSKVTLL